MDMSIPPLRIKILLESDPLKSRVLVRRLAIEGHFGGGGREDGERWERGGLAVADARRSTPLPSPV